MTFSDSRKRSWERVRDFQDDQIFWPEDISGGGAGVEGRLKRAESWEIRLCCSRRRGTW